MNTLVIYTDEKDEVCISYAKEIGGNIYILKFGKRKPSQGVIFKGTNLIENIKNFIGKADVIVFRKNSHLGRLILDSKKDLMKFKLLIVD